MIMYTWSMTIAQTPGMLREHADAVHAFQGTEARRAPTSTARDDAYVHACTQKEYHHSPEQYHRIPIQLV